MSLFTLPARAVKTSVPLLLSAIVIALMIAGCGSSAPSGSSGAAATGDTSKKYQVYLDLSYSGNNWSNEAANIIQALANTPPYDKQVEFHKIISGADITKQISDLQSMISAGADLILCYPLSPKALNGVVDQAVAKGTKIFFYDSTVTNPKAYNVSVITANDGENTAQYLVNLLHGKGNIFMNTGVAGTAMDTQRNEGALWVFKQYPDIHILTKYVSNWDAIQSKTNTLKALAAFPDVDGIWSQDGEYGVVQALQQTHHKMIPVVGENSNGYRNDLISLHKDGLVGVSAGSGPAVGGYAFKLGMALLTGQLKATDVPHNVEYPLPWVTWDKVVVGDGKDLATCNAFPLVAVPSSFQDAIFDPVLVPEINLDSALNGTPVPGATIQAIPASAIVKGFDIPGINSDVTEGPAGGMFKVNTDLVVPIPVP